MLKICQNTNIIIEVINQSHDIFLSLNVTFRPPVRDFACI